MNVDSVGIDIVDINRISAMPRRTLKAFRLRYFQGGEENYSLTKLASNLAIKEAVLKCTKDLNLLDFKYIQVLRDEMGAPKLNFDSRLLERGYKASDFRVSVSNQGNLVIAIAIKVK